METLTLQPKIELSDRVKRIKGDQERADLLIKFKEKTHIIAAEVYKDSFNLEKKLKEKESKLPDEIMMDVVILEAVLKGAFLYRDYDDTAESANPDVDPNKRTHVKIKTDVITDPELGQDVATFLAENKFDSSNQKTIVECSANIINNLNYHDLADAIEELRSNLNGYESQDDFIAEGKYGDAMIQTFSPYNAYQYKNVFNDETRVAFSKYSDKFAQRLLLRVFSDL